MSRPAPLTKPQPRKRRRAASGRWQHGVRRGLSVFVWAAIFFMVAAAALAVWQFRAHYTIALRSPVRMKLQWPWVVSARLTSEDAAEAEADQKRPLTAYQQYACRKFGSACRIALAIQRAENARGACEIWHYNSDGTLDWGYFQINTVHLARPGLNLRDLLDCKANIDFAYELYVERGFQPWSTYNSGEYRKFLRR